MSNERASLLELLKSMTGTRITHVPYKGAAPATLAAVSGEVSMTFTTTTAVLPRAKAGRLKIIAVTTLQRLAQLPEIPTVAESSCRARRRTKVTNFCF